MIDWLEKTLGHIQAAGHSFILALDEIEAILPTAESRGLPYWEEMLAVLRSLWQGYPCFQLMFAGVNPLVFERPSIGDRDNPVFAFVRPTYVKCMSGTEFNRMIRHLGKRTGVAWPTEVLERLYEETGGHPYLSRQVAAVIVSGLTPPESVSVDLLEARLGEVLLTRQDIFSEIFDSLNRHFPDELDDLRRIAHAGSLPTSEVDMSRLGHLLGYELVEISNRQVRQRVGLLARWLRDS
jgi:hypothetical protein